MIFETKNDSTRKRRGPLSAREIDAAFKLRAKLRRSKRPGATDKEKIAGRVAGWRLGERAAL